MANATFELAKTDRSKCAFSGETISKGSPRVGFEIWRVGRRCMTYQTPGAFLSRLALSVAEDGRSKCKLSGDSITKGALCVAFTTGGAKGETPTKQSCLLSKAAPFIAEVAKGSGKSVKVDKLVGFKALPSTNQKTVAQLLTVKASKGGSVKRPLAANDHPISKKARRA